MKDNDLGNALKAIVKHLDVLLSTASLDPALAGRTTYVRAVAARLATHAINVDPLNDLVKNELIQLATQLPVPFVSAEKLKKLDRQASLELVQGWIAQFQIRDDVAANDAIAKLLRSELIFQRGLAKAILNEAPAEHALEPPQDVLTQSQIAALENSITKHIPEAKGCRVKNFQVISGGFSKQTLFVSLSGTDVLPETIVLRIDKAVNVLGGAITDEYPLIAAMFEAGVAVPKPWFLEKDSEVLGGPFAVLNRSLGKTIGDPFVVNEPSRAFGLSMAHQLATIHKVSETVGQSGTPGRSMSIIERQLDDIRRCEETWRTAGQSSVILETSYSWLKRNINLADGPRGIIHNDFGCHNLLVEAGQITAVLDWEMAQIGTAAQDLGCAYSTVVQTLPWDEFLAAYAASGGIVPNPASIIYYRIWRDTWLLWTLTQARDALAGPLAEDVGLNWAVVTATHRIELRLCELLADVYGGTAGA